MKYREDCTGLIRLMYLIFDYNRTDWHPTIASMFEPNPDEELMYEEICDLSRELDVDVVYVHGLELDVRFNWQGRKKDIDWREYLGDLLDAYDNAENFPGILPMMREQIEYAAMAAKVQLIKHTVGGCISINDTRDYYGFPKGYPGYPVR